MGRDIGIRLSSEESLFVFIFSGQAPLFPSSTQEHYEYTLLCLKLHALWIPIEAGVSQHHGKGFPEVL